MAGPWKISELDVQIFPRAMGSEKMKWRRNLPRLLMVVVIAAVTSTSLIKVVVDVKVDFEPAKVWVTVTSFVDVQEEADGCFVMTAVLMLSSEHV